MTNVTGSVQLVERKRGPVWYLRYRSSSGRQAKKLLGNAWVVKAKAGKVVPKSGRCPDGHYTLKAAEAALAALLTDLRRGTLSGRSGASFADAATEFLRYVESVRQIDADTVADYRGVIDGYLLSEFGDIAIEKVTPDAIDAYKEKLLSGEKPEGRRKLSNRTIVRHLTVLHGIFKRAKRVWGLAENPAAADVVERPKVVYTGEFDTLDSDEVEQLATAAANSRDAVLYRVAAYTGLRQGELLALRWDCVDFVSGLIHVRRNFTGGREKVPKGKRVRSVPMMPAVIDALAALKEREHFTGDADLAFCSEIGGHLDHFKLRERFYAALERAGLRRIRFHDLRHAFGTAAIQKLDPYAVQSYMGHQHYSTTQRYLHHKPRREDAAALAEAFGRPVEAPAQTDATISGAKG